MTASREWNNLLDLKRFGYGHVDSNPGKGDMALFCAMCPQPGVNIPEDWKDDNRYDLSCLSSPLLLISVIQYI